MDPYSIARDEGEALWVFDALDTIKATADQTGGSFSVVEFLDYEGSSVPLHVNDSWDRGFYILEGDYTFIVKENRIAGSSGTWVFVPQGTPHAWRCDSPQGRLLNITAPGGFEEFYREVGKSVTDRNDMPPRSAPDVRTLTSTASRYGIRIIGPPPSE
jgi:quercetin dioxygenase-like cupin family protein